VGRVTLPAPLGTVTAHELESGEQQIKPGGLPSPSLVKNTVGRMTFLFQSHGFLDATASVEKAQDPAAHTVSFSFSVAPGEVYHMRDVVFAPDLTTDQKTQLTQTWKLPKGGVYEGAAVARSLASQRTMCGGRPPSFRLLPDHAAHQVDVSLSCQAQRQSR
jgi:outer membrane protein assembly factor BamA